MRPLPSTQCACKGLTPAPILFFSFPVPGRSLMEYGSSHKPSDALPGYHDYGLGVAPVDLPQVERVGFQRSYVWSWMSFCGSGVVYVSRSSKRPERRANGKTTDIQHAPLCFTGFPAILPFEWSLPCVSRVLPKPLPGIT